MTVIVDSNVIIAAFSARGLCAELFEKLLENHTIIVSRYILEEVERVFLLKFGMPADRVSGILTFLEDTATVASPGPLPIPLSRHPDDDPVLGLCHAVPADYLLTGDKDLLVLEQCNNVRIISPRDLWEREMRGTSLKNTAIRCCRNPRKSL